MNTRFANGFLALCMLCIAAAAQAHHSTANFDRNQMVTISGTVTYFSFTNPHSFFDIDVADEKSGTVVPHKVFAAGRVLLARYDWKPTDLKAGDRITVSGYPDRKDPSFMYLTRIVFASGKVWERTQIPD
jgi:hypothetical protein